MKINEDNERMCEVPGCCKTAYGGITVKECINDYTHTATDLVDLCSDHFDQATGGLDEIIDNLK